MGSRNLMTRKINVATEFSTTPIGRYRTDGLFSGEVFREDVLVPALTDNDHTIVVLDGIEGCGSSFLEEAFGGLVREHSFTPDALQEKLEISCVDTTFQEEIWGYIRSAKKDKK